MYNYSVHDAHGNPIGVLSLEKEDIPNYMMEGFRFDLECVYRTIPDKKFKCFMIVPSPMGPAEQALDNDRIDGTNDQKG